MRKPPAPPFKWVGGKRRLLSMLADYLPASFNDYHEPFLGGGAVALLMMENFPDRKFHLSDLNPHLINAWMVVRDSFEELAEHLAGHEGRHSEEYFDAVRDWDKRGLLPYKTPVEQASRFMYITQFCYRGMYEEDENGHCVSSVGWVDDYRLDRFQTERIGEVSKLLRDRDVSFSVQSFSDGLDLVGANDFVYLDPPYSTTLIDKTHNSNISYLGGLEAEDIQFAVKAYADSVIDRGGLVALSNADTHTTRHLYGGWSQVSTEIVHNMSMTVAVEKLFISYPPVSVLSHTV